MANIIISNLNKFKNIFKKSYLKSLCNCISQFSSTDLNYVQIMQTSHTLYLGKKFIWRQSE